MVSIQSFSLSGSHSILGSKSPLARALFRVEPNLCTQCPGHSRSPSANHDSPPCLLVFTSVMNNSEHTLISLVAIDFLPPLCPLELQVLSLEQSKIPQGTSTAVLLASRWPGCAAMALIVGVSSPCLAVDLRDLGDIRSLKDMVSCSEQ